MVARLQESQSELQTTLLVTKSNLTLALSNTEMLEEALSRADSSKGKDIGWKRWSDREGLLKRTQTPTTSSTLSQEPSTPGGASQEIGGESLRTPPADGPTPTSATLSTRISMELERRQPNRSQSDVPSSHGSSFMLPSITSSSAATTTSTAPPSRAPTPTPPGSEGSFFSKLRFGKSNASSSHLPDPSSSRLMPPGHQTPDFIVGPGVEDPRDALLSAEKKRADELSKMLEDERKAKAEALEDKANIELELESLSAALFEEVRLSFQRI
ncbi:hypothetical protein DL93DRAFT_1077277 [Clavulina sp. PMI_390]|nr:hypothetical protein DL93DRAFT_1077277 [Clavulina sp. PMI_390]